MERKRERNGRRMEERGREGRAGKEKGRTGDRERERVYLLEKNTHGITKQ